MMFERDTILRDLRKYVIEVTFTKVNGENRVMRCTLRPELLPTRYAEQDLEEGRSSAAGESRPGRLLHRVHPGGTLRPQTTQP